MTLHEFNPDPATRELLGLLRVINDAAYRQMDQTRMMDVCLTGLVRGFDCQGAALLVRDYEQRWLLSVHLSCQAGPEAIADIKTRMLESYRSWSREDIAENACTLELRYVVSDPPPARDIPSWRMLPLQVDAQCLGVLMLDHPQTPPAALPVICHHLCAALIASQNMRQLLITDAMTGCYNRWFMEFELSKFCEAPHPDHPPFALMLVDVDHFKHINDSHGHAAGDQCLVMVADMLRENLQTTDAVIRMGGDEFLIWFPQAGDREIADWGHQLCERAAASLRLPEAPDLPITLSIGMVIVDGSGECPEKETLLDRADQALYRAKRQGRNQAVCWQAEMAGVQE